MIYILLIVLCLFEINILIFCPIEPFKGWDEEDE